MTYREAIRELALIVDEGTTTARQRLAIRLAVMCLMSAGPGEKEVQLDYPQ